MSLKLRVSPCLSCDRLPCGRSQVHDSQLCLNARLTRLQTMAFLRPFRSRESSIEGATWLIIACEVSAHKGAQPNPPHPCYIFVFHDPRNCEPDHIGIVICSRIPPGALEIQLVCDLLTDPMERPPRLVFCNPDLLWRSDHPRPRFGQGAFKQALSSVYKARRF